MKTVPKGTFVVLQETTVVDGCLHAIIGAQGEFAAHACLIDPRSPDVPGPVYLPAGWRPARWQSRDVVVYDVTTDLVCMISADGQQWGYVLTRHLQPSPAVVGRNP
jgi:hypothetical protein